MIEAPFIEEQMTVEKIRDHFKDAAGRICTYHTNNSWVTKERLVEIETVYNYFVNVTVLNHKGVRLYRESVNFLSILDGEDKLEFVM